MAGLHKCVWLIGCLLLPRIGFISSAPQLLPAPSVACNTLHYLQQAACGLQGLLMRKYGRADGQGANTDVEVVKLERSCSNLGDYAPLRKGTIQDAC